jgi:beta-lactamase regulating signal transducer with metallopeptidase domain
MSSDLTACVLALLNGLWQAPLIALATWLLVRVALRTSAATRYAAWCVALVAAVASPVLTLQRFVRLPVSDAVLVAVVAVWALGAFAVLARTAFAAAALARIKRVAFPLAPSERAGLASWRALSPRTRDLRLCVSDEVDMPAAIGLFDAMVVLPQWLAGECSAAELDRLVLHEAAHLRRCDDWTKLLQNVAVALLFFNPAVRWIAAQMDLEREVACDDAAVASDADAASYASSLTRIARSAAWASRFALAPAAFNARRTLSLRIERLLGERNAARGISARALAGTTVALVLAFAGIRLVTPAATSAFTLPQDDPAVRAQALGLYARLVRGGVPPPAHAELRYWRQAEASLAAMGGVSNFQLRSLEAENGASVYVYGATIRMGTVTMRVTTSDARRVTAFVVEAHGDDPHRPFAYLASNVEAPPAVPAADARNIALSTAILDRVGDGLWPNWTKAPFAIALVTPHGPIEINFTKPGPLPSLPPLPPGVEATFPLPNGVPTIFMGEPQFVKAKTPIRWSVTLLHEHFHQWQDSWPGYFPATQHLGLAASRTDGMWMLNYPFPYAASAPDAAYATLAGRLVDALAAIGTPRFEGATARYLAARRAFKATLRPKDYKYFAFQCWQEGVARYTEVSIAQLAAREHARDRTFLTDGQGNGLAADSAATYASILQHLRKPDALRTDERVNFYALGAGEALVLDRVAPGWRSRYLDPRMDLSAYF